MRSLCRKSKPPASLALRLHSRAGVWQGLSSADEKRGAWLADVGARRLEQLNEIASRYAAPWSHTS
jgi:tagatose-1,6-bisphosphate aldolase